MTYSFTPCGGRPTDYNYNEEISLALYSLRMPITVQLRFIE